LSLIVVLALLTMIGNTTHPRGERSARAGPVCNVKKYLCEIRRPAPLLAGAGRRSTGRRRNYCFEPVVPRFGFGAQRRPCACASFSHAALLTYLHCSDPPFDVSMQNLPLPMALAVVSELLMLPLAPDEFAGGDICALAIDIPAIKAAIAVRVVTVFISVLLVSVMPHDGTIK
jgi:hypothetical protein